MIKIDGSTRVRNKAYTSPAILVELDLEARAGGSPKSPEADSRFNPLGVPPTDPDTLPTGG
jgi:hypothetical protein